MLLPLKVPILNQQHLWSKSNYFWRDTYTSNLIVMHWSHFLKPTHLVTESGYLRLYIIIVTIILRMPNSAWNLNILRYMDDWFWTTKIANKDLINRTTEGFSWENSLQNKNAHSHMCIFNETIVNICHNFVPNKILTCNDKDVS